MDDGVIARVRLGDETYHIRPPKRCTDCGVHVGNYHPVGCRSEECPQCGERGDSHYCEHMTRWLDTYAPQPDQRERPDPWVEDPDAWKDGG